MSNVYAQVVNGMVNLIGGEEVGLPYNGQNVLSVDITNIPENDRPKEGWYYKDGLFSSTGKPILEPTTKELIASLQQENILLKAQVQANTELTEFHEDLIVEMAMKVYQ
jgi:hypothetical protein